MLLCRSTSFTTAARPTAGFRQRFAGFEETLEACQESRPAARNGLDELRVGLVDLMEDGELDRLARFFEFIGQARIAFGVQLGFEFIAPREDELACGGSISRISPLSATRPSGIIDPPRSAGFPFGFLPVFRTSTCG